MQTKLNARFPDLTCCLTRFVLVMKFGMKNCTIDIAMDNEHPDLSAPLPLRRSHHVPATTASLRRGPAAESQALHGAVGVHAAVSAQQRQHELPTLLSATTSPADAAHGKELSHWADPSFVGGT
jgi:hypothetical protein